MGVNLFLDAWYARNKKRNNLFLESTNPYTYITNPLYEGPKINLADCNSYVLLERKTVIRDDQTLELNLIELMDPIRYTRYAVVVYGFSEPKIVHTPNRLT